MTAGKPAPSPEAPFLSENELAMTKMTADMAVKPTGDVDPVNYNGAADLATYLFLQDRAWTEMLTADYCVSVSFLQTSCPAESAPQSMRGGFLTDVGFLKAYGKPSTFNFRRVSEVHQVFDCAVYPAVADTQPWSRTNSDQASWGCDSGHNQTFESAGGNCSIAACTLFSIARRRLPFVAAAPAFGGIVFTPASTYACRIPVTASPPTPQVPSNADCGQAVQFVRDRHTGQLAALVAVTIQFEAVPGGDMEGLAAVGNLRNASGVFFLAGSCCT